MAVPASPDDLTPAWLADRLGGASIGSVSAEVIGVGFGLGGTVARLTIDGDGPATLIAKWCNAKKGAAERRFYEEHAPGLGIDLPALHGAEVDEEADRAVLLLEDIVGATQGDCILGAPPREIEALARAEATFHARTWKSDSIAELPGWRDEPSRFVDSVDERRPRFLEMYGADLPENVRELTSRLPQLLHDSAEELRAGPWALIHTDLHLDNVVFRPGGEPVILDWPDAKRGPPAVDLAHIMTECVTLDHRREHEDGIVTAYLDALRDAGITDYARDDLERHMYLAGLHHYAGMLWWAARDDPRTAIPRVQSIIDHGLERAIAYVADHAE